MKGEKTGGRQKGSLNKETILIKSIIDEVVDWKQLVTKLYELSNGVVVKEDEKVYSKAPDTAATKLLLEYRFGRPKQELTIDTPDESDLTLKLEIVKKEQQPPATDANK